MFLYNLSSAPTKEDVVASKVVELYKSYPPKYREEFYGLVLSYVLNQRIWIRNEEGKEAAFNELHKALRRLKHDPFNMTTEDVEEIVNNHEDWMADLVEMEKFNGNA